MSESNPYAAPQSNLESNAPAQASYYVTSKKKFMVLFISTAGMYILFWFWKNWNLVKGHEGSSVWPIPRAIFSVFFIHSLFKKISKTAESQNRQLPALTNAATVFVVLVVVSYISGQVITAVIFSIISLFVTLGVQIWCIWQAQMQANIICNDAEGVSNDNFSGGNIALIIFGIFTWLVVIASIIVVSRMVL